MDYLLAVIFVGAGIACFIYYEHLYKALAGVMANRYRETFGRLAHVMGWDDPSNRWNLIIYKSGILFLGLFFLVMAFHFVFGPIYIGQAHPATPRGGSCKVNADCSQLDCRDIGPWYCGRDGFAICGSDNVCTCALTCL